MMTSHHRLEDNGKNLDRVGDHILTHKSFRVRNYKLVITQEPVADPDEDPTVVNPSSSTGLSLPVEQRDRSRRQLGSRSRERAPQRTTILPTASTCCTSSWRASDSASGQSGCRRKIRNWSSTRPHKCQINSTAELRKSKESKGKKTKGVGKPNNLLFATKHKSLDSDEDDEEPK